MTAFVLDPLIAEAQRRAHRRRLLLLALVLLGVGTAAAAYAIGGVSRPATSRISIPAGATGAACGVRGVGTRILTPAGQTLYREPGNWDHPNRGFPAIQCSGSAIWALWFNGIGTGNEAYVGARSLDRGKTWRLVFANPYSWRGVKSPRSLGSEVGVWALRGSRDAYFTAVCPFCSAGRVQGTVALWVTRDAGRTFRMYAIPALTGFAPERVRVAGHSVTVEAKRLATGLPPHKSATVRIG